MTRQHFASWKLGSAAFFFTLALCASAEAQPGRTFVPPTPPPSPPPAPPRINIPSPPPVFHQPPTPPPQQMNIGGVRELDRANMNAIRESDRSRIQNNAFNMQMDVNRMNRMNQSPPSFQQPHIEALREMDRMRNHQSAINMQLESQRMLRMTQPNMQNRIVAPFGAAAPAADPRPAERRGNLTTIRTVNREGLAANLGLQEGDVIQSYDGVDVEAAYRFAIIRRAEPVGGPAREMIVRRGDELIAFNVPPGVLGLYLEDR
jgi:hypothetical protein